RLGNGWTGAGARNITVPTEMLTLGDFTAGYADNKGRNGWFMDQTIRNLYDRNRGTGNAFDLAIRAHATVTSTDPGVRFDSGLDALAGKRTGTETVRYDRDK